MLIDRRLVKDKPTKQYLCCFFILSVLLYCQCLPSAQADEDTCLINFGQQQCGPFEALPGVIIKAVLSKQHLQERLNRQVTQLAMLGEANLYLVPSDNPRQDAEALSREDGILYAQPDIVQPRSLHGYSSETDFTATLPAALKANKGEGIKVAVIDDGFNLEHEDLKGATVGFSYDADLKQLGATPQVRGDRHGTQVAGVVVAQHNGLGIDGIAPKATLIPIRQASTRTSDTVLSFTVANLAGADIINCSWNSRVLMEPVNDVIQYLTQHGRNGRGSIIIFAAGNEGQPIKPGSKESAINTVITVGSQLKGKIAPYSNYGERVDLYLPGQIRTTYHQGYGWFNGTSASAAMASGLSALLLASNPTLTLNELQETLVARSKEIWPLSATQADAQKD